MLCVLTSPISYENLISVLFKKKSKKPNIFIFYPLKALKTFQPKSAKGFKSKSYTLTAILTIPFLTSSCSETVTSSIKPPKPKTVNIIGQTVG